MSNVVKSLDIGITLTGGGAKGAYQAGVMAGISEIIKQYNNESIFSYFSGISAGSINCAYIASSSFGFSKATMGLAKIWNECNPSLIFSTRAKNLAGSGLAWVTDLGLGGLIGPGHGKSLLSTVPLQKLLENEIDPLQLKKNIKIKKVKGLSVTATNYRFGTTVTFFDGEANIRDWYRNERMGIRQKITYDHIMASAAIPFFFPAVLIGNSYFGDGCIRMMTPLGPNIHMGAKAIIAISVKNEKRPIIQHYVEVPTIPHYPYIAEIAGHLMNSIFSDTVSDDVERATRINKTLSLIPKSKLKEQPGSLRNVPILAIYPNQDLGVLAKNSIHFLPKALKYFLKGLGALNENGYNLLSYMAFEKSYTSVLVSLGYDDAFKHKNEILVFIDQLAELS